MRVNINGNIIFSEGHKMDSSSFWTQGSLAAVRFFCMVVFPALALSVCDRPPDKSLAPEGATFRSRTPGRSPGSLLHWGNWFSWLREYPGSFCKGQSRGGEMSSNSTAPGSERAKHCPSLAEWIFRRWNLIWVKVGLTAMETVFKPLLKGKKKRKKPYVLHIQLLLVPEWMSSPDN